MSSLPSLAYAYAAARDKAAIYAAGKAQPAHAALDVALKAWKRTYHVVFAMGIGLPPDGLVRNVWEVLSGYSPLLTDYHNERIVPPPAVV